MSHLIGTCTHHDTGIPGDYCDLSESPCSGERQDCHVYLSSRPGKRAYEEYDPATEWENRFEER